MHIWGQQKQSQRVLCGCMIKCSLTPTMHIAPLQESSPHRSKDCTFYSYDTLSDPGKMSHAGLRVNGKIRSWQAWNNYGGKSQGFTSSNSAILLLQKGDVVYVEGHLAAATIGGLYSDFSGAKLN